MPSGDEDPSEDLLERVELLYTDDAMLHDLWAEAIDIQRLAGDAASGGRQLDQHAPIAGSLLSSRNGAPTGGLESLGGVRHTTQGGHVVGTHTTHATTTGTRKTAVRKKVEQAGCIERPLY